MNLHFKRVRWTTCDARPQATRGPNQRANRSRRFRLFPMTILLTLLAAAGLAARATAGDQTPRVVAARVGNRPIYVADVERQLAAALKSRKLDPAAARLLKATALSQLIDRQLILGYLEKTRVAASEQDVDFEIEQIKKQLARRNRTLDDYFEQTSHDEASLRALLAWRESWQRYLDRHLTDANLEKFFNQRRRDFDGTQIRAAHILLRVESPDDAAAIDAAVDRAKQLHRRIASGELSFRLAAGQFSDAPTAQRGGELGLIPRRGVMPEAFSKAAFALDKGKTSQPVVTAFGVHLIRCLDVEPGDKTWRDVRRPLAEAATEFLFEWIAQRERPRAKIEFTGAAPHFKPGTKELAEEE